jgi:hypothetical protein
MKPMISTVAALVSTAVLTAACGVASPTAPAPSTPTATPIALTELRSYYEPIDVYAGASTQVHIGTFGREADGTIRAVYDLPCTFTSDGGVLSVAPAGADSSWHVAVLYVSHAMGGQPVHVHASCGGLETVVGFTVIPDGILPPRPGPAPAPVPAPTPVPTTPGGSR